MGHSVGEVPLPPEPPGLGPGDEKGQENGEEEGEEVDRPQAVGGGEVHPVGAAHPAVTACGLGEGGDSAVERYRLRLAAHIVRGRAVQVLLGHMLTLQQHLGVSLSHQGGRERDETERQGGERFSRPIAAGAVQQGHVLLRQMVDQLLRIEDVAVHHAGHLHGDLKEQVRVVLFSVLIAAIFTPGIKGEVDEDGLLPQAAGQLELFLLREAGVEEQHIADDVPRTVEGRGGGAGQELAPGGLHPAAVIQPQGHRAAVVGKSTGKIAQPAVPPAIGAGPAAGGEQDRLLHGGTDDLPMALVVEIGEHAGHQTPQSQEEGGGAEEDGTQRMPVHKGLLSVWSGREQGEIKGGSRAAPPRSGRRWGGFPRRRCRRGGPRSP